MGTTYLHAVASLDGRTGRDAAWAAWRMKAIMAASYPATPGAPAPEAGPATAGAGRQKVIGPG